MKAYNLQTASNNKAAITALYLHNCQLNAIPALVFELPKLKYLDLSQNNFKQIPHSITRIKHLEGLDLSGNPIEVFPDFLAQLPLLHQLNLSDNRIEQLPNDINRLQQLVELRLANNTIRKLPDTLFQIPNLVSLDCSNNKIKIIPPNVGRLKQLKFLSLSNNLISSLPAEIGDCPALEILDLRKNKLRLLPDRITALGNLRRLLLANNKIQQLPPNLHGLQLLRVLDASQNQLQKLPNEIGMLSWLHELRLGKNNLKRLPNTLNTCKQLQKLSVAQNQITQLDLAELDRLYWLDASKNELKNWPAVPDAIETLLLAHNRIKTLPQKKMALPKLKTLDLRENLINKLPKSFSGTPMLAVIGLKGNPLTVFPASLFQIPQLQKVIGSLPMADKRLFLRTYKYFKQAGGQFTLTATQLYHLLSGNYTILDSIDFSTLFQLLSINAPRLQYQVKQKIFQDYSGTSNPLSLDMNLAFAGKSVFSIRALGKQLDQLQINWRNEITRATTHVVLGQGLDLSTIQLPPNIAWITEQQLQAFINKLKPPFLLHQPDAQQMARVQQLLDNNKEENQLLGLQILDTGGVPDSLLTDLFVAWKRTKVSGIKNQARALLVRYLTFEEQEVLLPQGNWLETAKKLKRIDQERLLELVG